MGGSYGKVDDEYREAIYYLRKQGKTGAEIHLILAAGGFKLPGSQLGLKPLTVSARNVNHIARRMLDERDQLYESKVQKKPTTQGLAILSRRLMLVAEKEVVRIERSQRAGKMHAGKVRDLAKAMEGLLRLQERLDQNELAAEVNGDAAGNGSTSSFADQLISGEDEQPTETVSETPQESAERPEPQIADVKLPERKDPLAGLVSAES